ncbi:MAG: type I glyceraldehyde-3-phosphate dehydrogenase [Patescibacteria group bacterium]|nr:type I glyceraldehyde-3-phosphate dehydrogenase [Patescibacteria group bacterium]
MALRVAINGFGRVGKAVFKIMHDKKDIEVVAINNLAPADMTAHLLKYDSIYGVWNHDVSSYEGGLIVDGKKYPIVGEKEPSKLPWKKLNVDIVIESTGKFTKHDDAAAHLHAGAKRVIISAPAKGGDIQTIVMGVNDNVLKDQDIVSNASCTTNCIAPVMAIIHKKFGIKKAAMTTVHAYTADQNLVDGSHKKDLRRARAAAMNIVPTSTGAASAMGEVVPDLAGIFDGIALRVPVPVVSLSDFTIVTKKPVTVEGVNAAFVAAKDTPQFKDVLDATDAPIVSSDIIGNPHASIVDLALTKVIDGDLLKVVSWYDNEWGYSCALVRLCERMA